MNNAAPARQRLDKWLWFARVVKSRSLAAKLVADGHVRVNGAKVEIPAKPVGTPDVVTISLERRVRILRVLLPGERRGPFSEANLLFEDLTEEQQPASREADRGILREPGSGRPTKKDRRETTWLKSGES